MVKNGFVKKNVGTLTLGERLNKLRSEKRITLSEASRSTKIQVKYLEYLESGRYDKLPVDVYAKGFLRSYAQYLGVDDSYLIKLYDREREIHNNIKKDDPKQKIFQPVRFSRLIVTPKILIAALVVFFVFLGFFYLYRELSIFVSNPRLAITQPLDNFSTGDKTLTVEGFTDKDAKLLINGQATSVNEDGKFSEVLILQPGLNTITVKATNRFDKESEKIITGEATFQIDAGNADNNSQDAQNPPDQNNQDSNQTKIQAEIYSDTKAASIIIKADGVEVYSGKISPGEAKNFEAKENISISADKGKYVGVKINGKDLGTLSKDTKPVNNRIFSTN